MGEPTSRADHTIITIGNAGEVVVSSSTPPFISTKSCIFKTPNILSRHNERAYLPNAFSIGPLHHGQPHLKAAEKLKSQYLHGLLSRKPTPGTNLEDLTKAIGEMEGDARDCYAVPTDNYSAKDFVNMLVLDGCFIIELLRKDAMKDKDKNDPVFSMACMLQFLNHDLILLENQIPWFVLHRLFELTSEPTNIQSLTNLAIDFFGSNFSMTSIPIVDANHGSKHILDLLRNTLVLSSMHKKGQLYGKWELIPSATSLKEAGVKFKKGESSGNILNISFKNGVLEILPLLIQETTNDAFRNLISFEQCFPNCTANITSYAILLDNLINTTKDISILQEEGIIDNWLNPQDTIEFFNKLYHDTYVKEFYYLGLCKKVNAYCKRCWPRARAAYLHNHFGDPWAIVSQVVGGIILLLALLQTIYTMKEK